MTKETKVTCKFEYQGELNSELDFKLTKFMETYGWEWYAQGYNLETKTRDICFEMTIKTEEKK